MAFRGLNVMNLCRLFWILMSVSANGETLLMNVSVPWNEARQYCQGNGKSFFDVTKDGYNDALKGLLNETDQAWVAATMELSHFIKQPVCMKTTGLQFDTKKFDTNTIGNCLKFCDGNPFIGLKDRDCICFTNISSLERSKYCNVKCNNHPIHQCGGNESISLYEKVDTSYTKTIAPNANECVYAKKSSTRTKLFTASCVWQIADGGICEGGNYTECTARKWTPFGKELCRMDLLIPFGWNQTRTFCADIGGQLSSQIESWRMKDNLTYWLGIRRIPTFHRANGLQLNKNDTYCAVARKKGDVVLIEGEDCLKKNAIVCQDQEILESTSSLTTKPNEKTTQSNRTDSDQTEILESTSSLTTKPNEKTNERTRTDSDLADNMVVYIAIAVSTAMLFALFFVALIFVTRKRRQQLQHTEIRTTGRTREQHTAIHIRASTLTISPFGPVYNETEPEQSPYEDIVLTQNEQTLTESQPVQSSPAQTDYEKLDTHGEHDKETDLHVYDLIIQE